MKRFILTTREDHEDDVWNDYWAAIDRADGFLPEAFVALARNHDLVLTVSTRDCQRLESWRLSHGLGLPPFGVLDRQAPPGLQRDAADELSWALRRDLAEQALRSVLLDHDAVLTLAPDPDDARRWHCSIDGAPWRLGSGATPEQALHAAYDTLEATGAGADPDEDEPEDATAGAASC